MSSLIKHNDLYFIDSTKINVFPCAYRGYKDQANNQIIFDPESRLNTEKNLASPTGKLGYLTSYIVSSDSNTLKLNIAGYVFEISDITATDLHAEDRSELTAAIKLTTVKLDTNEQTPSTKILSSWLSDDNPALDQPVGTTDHIFTGLVFYKDISDLPEVSSEAEVVSLSSISVQVDDSWVYNKKYSLPKIESNDSSGITIPEGDLVLSDGGLFVGKLGQDPLLSVTADNNTVIVGNPTDPVLSVNTGANTVTVGKPSSQVLSVNTDTNAIIVGKSTDPVLSVIAAASSADSAINLMSAVTASTIETPSLKATTITPRTSAEQSRISGFKTISGTTISGTTISGTTINGVTINTDEVYLGSHGSIRAYIDEDSNKEFTEIDEFDKITSRNMSCTDITAVNAQLRHLQILAPGSSTSTDTFTIKNSSGGTETTRVKVNAKAQSPSDALMTLCNNSGFGRIWIRPDSSSTTNANCVLEVYGSTRTNTLFIGDTNVGTELVSIGNRLNTLGFSSGDITNMSTSYISGGKFYKMGKMFCGQLNLTGKTAYQADYTNIGTIPNWVNLQTDIICTFKLITTKQHDSGTDTTQITIKLSASDKVIYRMATTPGSKRESSKLPTVVAAWYFDENNTQHLCFAAASDTD